MTQSTAGSAPSVPSEDAKPQRKPPVKLLIPIALVGLAVFAWQKFGPQASSDVLKLSGRIEADETDVGVKTGGRIVSIGVREGDSVKAGQVIAEIADDEIPEQLRAATAQVASAQQEEQQARLDIQVAESRIRESQLGVQQSEGDASGRISQAKSTVAAAEENLATSQANVSQAQAQIDQAQAQVSQAQAQWRQAKASLKLAQADRARYASLLAQGATSQQRDDQAQTAVETAQATVDSAAAAITTAQAGVATARSTREARESAVNAARDQLAATQGGLTQTESAGLNPAIRGNQLEALVQQQQQASSRLLAAQSKVKTARANQDQIQRRIDAFKIKSPIDGIVQSRPLEPGAVVTTGKTLITLINPQMMYLRGFIPSGDLNSNKVHVGMTAKVFLDGSPNAPLTAKLTAIDPNASFTPENIYFKNDRVRQVFGVKLAIEQSQGLAKPGMPADAEISLK
jgi:HlyD family secretion protein